MTSQFISKTLVSLKLSQPCYSTLAFTMTKLLLLMLKIADVFLIPRL